MSGEIHAESVGGVRRLRLLGHGERNAMTPPMMQRLAEEFRSVPDETRVIVISGAGNGWFCGGGHVGSLEDIPIDRARAISDDFIEFHRALRRVQVPVIAHVDGHVAAQGVALVAACDLAVAPRDAEFVMPEINVGLIPLLAMGILSRHLSPKQVFELSYLGQRFTAEDALGYGLLTRVADDAAATTAQVEQWVGELVARSPVALALGRAAFITMMYDGIDRDLEIAAGNLTAMFLAREVQDTLRQTGGQAFADRVTGR